jgi:hypothetical protein
MRSDLADVLVRRHNRNIGFGSFEHATFDARPKDERWIGDGLRECADADDHPRLRERLRTEVRRFGFRVLKRLVNFHRFFVSFVYYNHLTGVAII